MKKIVLLFLFLIFGFELNAKTEVDKAFNKRTKITTGKFTLYSPDIYENKQIRNDQVFDGFDCGGKNISPKLVWKNAPEDTKSFAITMFDNDAKTSNGWWHWIVYNIPADTELLDVGASDDRKLMPKGAVQGLNDYGFKKYGGVCPPAGSKHNYIITIYALDVEKLKLPKNVMPAMVNYHLNKHKIGTATIKAFYKRDAKVANKEEISSKNDSDKDIKNSKNVNNKKYFLKEGISAQSKIKTKNNNSKKNSNKNKTSKNKEYDLNLNKKNNDGIKKNVIIEK